MKFPTLVLFIFTFLSTGCSLINLDRSPDYATTPGYEYEVLEQGSPVVIVFTEDVEAYTVEQCVSIDDQRGKMKTSLRWENNRILRLVPLEDPLPGWEYHLEFNGIYSASSGKSVESKLSLPFFWVKSHFSPLEIISVSPSESDVVSENRAIEMTFSSEVNEASFSKGFSISPGLETDMIWRDRTLTISPSDRWENLTTYTLKLTEEVMDKSGNRLYPEWESSFYVETGRSVPSVLSTGSCSGDRSADFPRLAANLDTLAFDQALRIRFSESMDKESAESAFSLTPSLAGDLYWSPDPLRPGVEDMIFLPRDGFVMSQSYRLLISSSASAETGIGMKSDFVEDFTADIDELTLLSMECLSYGGFTLNTYGSDSAFDLPAGPVSPFNLSFRFTFSRPFASDSEKQLVQDRLKIYEVFSSGGSPGAGLYSWASDSAMTVLFSGFISDTESDYYYMLELPGGPGGIRNREGSFFRDDVKQLFRVVRL